VLNPASLEAVPEPVEPAFCGMPTPHEPAHALGDVDPPAVAVLLRERCGSGAMLGDRCLRVNDSQLAATS
jgi:hypothetical protein